MIVLNIDIFCSHQRANIRFIQFTIKKMNAIIKIGNLQYLKVLQQLLFSKVQVKQQKTSTVKLSFFNLVELIIQIYQDFTKAKENSLQVFILNFFMEKYASSFELYRHMFGFICMWKKYVECHEEARILLSILSTQRSGKESVKLFLKIRKSILKNIHSKIMQDIILSHQDIIAVSHTIFSSEMKSFVSRKIHELFINLRRKSTNSDKMNGAVVCQFFMNCAEKFEKQEFDNIKVYYQQAPEEEQPMHLQIIKGRTFKPLDIDNLQDFNPTFKPPPNHKAAYLQSDIQNEEEINSFPQQKSSTKNPPSNFILDNIWNRSIHRPTDPLQNAKQIVNKKYSNSWQRLLKTNQQMKQKLLRNHQQNL